MEVLSEVVLDPEPSHEVLADAVGQFLVLPGRGRNTDDAIQRGHPAESVHSMTLRDTVRLDPRGPLHVIARPFYGPLFARQRCEIVRSQVD